MGKVLAMSKTGAYEVPKERFFNRIDLAHDVGGIVGGTANAEKEPYRAGLVKVVGYEPIVEIYRMPIGENRYLEAVKDFTGSVKPLGISTLDNQGEPIYEENLTGKEFPVVLGGIDKDDYDEIVSELKEEVGEEAVKNPMEYLKKVYDEKGLNGIKPLSITAYKLLKKMPEGERENFFKPPMEVKAEDVISKGERVTLNGVLVGADEKGNVVVLFTPERTNLVPATRIAKELNTQRKDFKLFGYLANVRYDQFTDPEKKEKLSKRFKAFVDEVKQSGKGKIPVESIRAIKELINKVKDVMENPTEEKVAELNKMARKEAFRVIKEHIQKTGLLRDGMEKLIVKGSDKMFLRNTPDNVGMPLMDYTKVDTVGIVMAPRVINTTDKGWTVKRVPKVLGMTVKGEDGKSKVKTVKADSATIAKEYRIYKALKPFITGKIGDKNVTISQLRALYGDGFENFKGLDAIKEELSESKSAVQLVGFIDYLKDEIGKVLFKEGVTVDEVKNHVANLEPVKELQEGMLVFLAERPKYKAVNLDDFAEIDANQAVKELLKRGVLFRNKDNEYVVSRKGLKENAKELEKMFKLKDGVSLRGYAQLAASTLNFGVALKNAEFPVLKEAEKVHKHVARALSLGEKEFDKPYLIPNLDGKGMSKEIQEDERVKAWKEFLKGSAVESEVEQEVKAAEEEVKQEEIKTTPEEETPNSPKAQEETFELEEVEEDYDETDGIDI